MLSSHAQFIGDDLASSIYTDIGESSYEAFWCLTYQAVEVADTDEERQAEDEARVRRQARAEGEAERRDLQKMIMANGVRPEGAHVVDPATYVMSTQNLYGGGDWFAVTEENVWYIRNNGADGDDWGANNVITGGAGAIGWRLSRTDEIGSAVARRVRALEAAFTTLCDP